MSYTCAEKMSFAGRLVGIAYFQIEVDAMNQLATR